MLNGEIVLGDCLHGAGSNSDWHYAVNKECKKKKKSLLNEKGSMSVPFIHGIMRVVDLICH